MLPAGHEEGMQVLQYVPCCAGVCCAVLWCALLCCAVLYCVDGGCSIGMDVSVRALY
jgi:hypothetical protein